MDLCIIHSKNVAKYKNSARKRHHSSAGLRSAIRPWSDQKLYVWVWVDCHRNEVKSSPSIIMSALLGETHRRVRGKIIDRCQNTDDGTSCRTPPVAASGSSVGIIQRERIEEGLEQSQLRRVSANRLDNGLEIGLEIGVVAITVSVSMECPKR